MGLFIGYIALAVFFPKELLKWFRCPRKKKDDYGSPLS